MRQAGCWLIAFPEADVGEGQLRVSTASVGPEPSCLGDLQNFRIRRNSYQEKQEVSNEIPSLERRLNRCRDSLGDDGLRETRKQLGRNSVRRRSCLRILVLDPHWRRQKRRGLTRTPPPKSHERSDNSRSLTVAWGRESPSNSAAINYAGGKSGGKYGDLRGLRGKEVPCKIGNMLILKDRPFESHPLRHFFFRAAHGLSSPEPSRTGKLTDKCASGLKSEAMYWRRGVALTSSTVALRSRRRW